MNKPVCEVCALIWGLIIIVGCAWIVFGLGLWAETQGSVEVLS